MREKLMDEYMKYIKKIADFLDKEPVLKGILILLGGLAILDAKRNDIGNTAKAYAISVFDNYKADAVTINSYLGIDGVKPFMEYEDRGIFALVKTSNKSSGQFQDLFAMKLDAEQGQMTFDISGTTTLKRNYMHMAELVNSWAQESQIKKG